MIRLTRLNHAPLVLNSDLIERIDLTPDTVITLTNGQIFRVLEAPGVVIDRIIEFRRAIHWLEPCPAVSAEAVDPARAGEPAAEDS
jgi:flagellar protein FlbD